MDEPFNGIDPPSRKKILQAVFGEFRYGEQQAIVIPTHLVSEVEEFIDDVVYLRDGEIALMGSAQTLLAASPYMGVLIVPFLLAQSFVSKIKAQTNYQLLALPVACWQVGLSKVAVVVMAGSGIWLLTTGAIHWLAIGFDERKERQNVFTFKGKQMLATGAGDLELDLRGAIPRWRSMLASVNLNSCYPRRCGFGVSARKCDKASR